MTSDEAVEAILDIVNDLKIPYMLTGSIASNVYGIERSTKDADLVVQSEGSEIWDLGKKLSAPLSMDSQATFETITGTTRYIIKHAERPFSIELFLLSDDPHDQERFRRRKQASIMSRSAWLPTPEDVVITKLRWSRHGQRSKDVDDVRNVIAVQDDRLDWNYIHRWCELHQTRALLDQIRQSIPKRTT